MAYTLLQNSINHMKTDLKLATSFLEGSYKTTSTAYNIDIRTLISYTFIFTIFLTIVVPAILGFDRFKEMHLLAAMPVTKKQIIITKLVLIFSSIFSAVVTNYLVLAGLYLNNKQLFDQVPWSRRLSHITTESIILLLILMCIACFFTLIQCLTGKSIFGIVVGYMSLSFPAVLFALVGIILTHNFKGNYAIVESFLNKIADTGILSKINDMNFINWSMLIFTLIALISIIYLFNRIPVEKSGELFTFKFAEVLFKIGISTLAALIVILSILAIQDANGRSSYVVDLPVNLIVIIVFPLSYYIQTWFFKRMNSR
jgi:hypothetical protein